jgi:hypothetical protein
MQGLSLLKDKVLQNELCLVNELWNTPLTVKDGI